MATTSRTSVSTAAPIGPSTASPSATSAGKKMRVRSITGPNSEQNPMWRPSEEALEIWKKEVKQKPLTEEAIHQSFCHHAVKTLARSSFNMDDFAAYQAVSYSIRDRLLDKWNNTQQFHTAHDSKRVYYLSLEFLLGRTLDNAMLNMGVKDIYKSSLEKLGFKLDDLIGEEVDAALGNGGLGRLAACYLDSMATQDYPCWGYGIRYTYGIFQQRIIDGYQTEFPDYWLNFGNPWEIQRLDIAFEVRFRGQVSRTVQEDGTVRHEWEGGEKVVAVAYDYPIPGYGTNNCINIRLWSSKPQKEFDFASFNEGNYDKSVEEQKKAENITSVLYPNDNHMVGKILRLKQQYFFVCATLQDIVRRFKKSDRPWDEFPNQVAIQLNDTHPTLSIVELQRILVDEEGLSWDNAWNIVTQTYSFTNHTVLPEALEKWSVPLLQELLPRHLMIIFDINLFFLQQVEKLHPGDREILSRLSIIEEGHPQHVRMAYLAIVGSHKVNGVAALHSMLLKKTVFKDFVDYYGEDKFTNVTNGITPRRWLHQANPKLSALITETLGTSSWLKDLSKLSKLKSLATNKDFQQKWMEIKLENKARLADLIRHKCGVVISPDAMFDIQCKRLHEYKRQFMNILYVIYRYQKIKAMKPDERKKKVVPRAVIFAGKSAPGYYIAKLIIKLINNVATVINEDPDTNEYLNLVFIPNYNVSIAEIMIPASDISQHISTAGTEASGTSNMKFVLNGGLILGTVDGANIEIRDEIGNDNIWLFGALAHEVDDIRHNQRFNKVEVNPELEKVVKSIARGDFGDAGIFDPLLATVTIGGDYYIIGHDFPTYIKTQEIVDEAYLDKTGWATKSIRASAGMGMFSGDRCIVEYAEKIWKVTPLPVPDNAGYDYQS